MKSLYDILGIKPGADEPTIKKAYSKKSKAAHPDHGGNTEDMAAINEAYDILSNAQRRLHYDRTGEDRAMTDLDKLASDIVVGLFDAYLREDAEFPGNIIQNFKRLVGAKEKDYHREIRECAKKLKKLERTAKRIRGSELVEALINERRQAVNKEIARRELLIQAHIKVNDLLDKITDSGLEQDEQLKALRGAVVISGNGPPLFFGR